MEKEKKILRKGKVDIFSAFQTTRKIVEKLLCRRLKTGSKSVHKNIKVGKADKKNNKISTTYFPTKQKNIQNSLRGFRNNRSGKRR